MNATQHLADASFQVRFESLFQPGRALAFPCDARGNVPLDAMPQRARNNYLFARAMIGRDFAMPRVVPAGA
jgi:hypothetical protein